MKVTIKTAHGYLSPQQHVTIANETRLICEWAEISGLRIGRIWKRLSVGWSPERAVFAPLRADRRRAV